MTGVDGVKLKKEVFITPQFKDWAEKNVVLLELDYPRRKQQDEKLKKQNRELQQIFQVKDILPFIFLM